MSWGKVRAELVRRLRTARSGSSGAAYGERLDGGERDAAGDALHTGRVDPHTASLRASDDLTRSPAPLENDEAEKAGNGPQAGYAGVPGVERGVRGARHGA